MFALTHPGKPTLSVQTHSFKAFGSTVGLTAVGVGKHQLEICGRHAIAFAETWEQRFSRFRSDSELSLLNNSGNIGRQVTPEFLEVLEAALQAWRRTSGRFDPSLLNDVVALGYDRDFELMRKTGVRVTTHDEDEPPASLDDLTIDRSSLHVKLPRGRGFDFGGIAKGIFVDRLFARFEYWPGGCIDASGDLRVWGEPPDGDHWLVGIEDPFDLETDRCRITVITEDAGAIATSALNRKVWTVGGQKVHHLIDPSNGRPVAGRIVSATAIARDLVTAEVATKALLVASSRGESLDPIDASTALVIDESNNAVQIGGCDDRACQIFTVDPEARSA